MMHTCTGVTMCPVALAKVIFFLKSDILIPE